MLIIVYSKVRIMNSIKSNCMLSHIYDDEIKAFLNNTYKEYHITERYL